MKRNLLKVMASLAVTASLVMSIAISAIADGIQGDEETGYYALVPSSGTDTINLSSDGVSTLRIYDGGGPNGSYNNNWNGTLEIIAPIGYQIRLNSNSINLEGNEYDKLYVYEGDTQLCYLGSSTGTIDLTTNGNTMRIKFITDYSVTDSGFDLTATIIPYTVITTTPSASAITYGQTLADSTLTGGEAYVNGVLTEGEFTWSDGSVVPSVADSDVTEYEVTFDESPALTCNVTLTVNKADCTVTPPTGNTLAYTEADQQLIVAGSAEGGTMLYSLSEDGEFSEEIPVAADPGTYTVYYEVVGDENHNDVAPQSVTATIAEPEPAPVPVPTPTPAPAAPAAPAPDVRAMNINNFVERLYVIALDRTYDTIGRDYWIDQLLNQGNSGAYVARGFFFSQEFLGRDLSDEEFVTILYSVFFDRTPDAEGFANWTSALANGASRAQVIDGFAYSTEWTSTCARFDVNP
ncbi:MAG: DUF4214 domain-containing protein [Clostridiales bacterium]|nr:DUF4214 domain-containing protein [Clostridiales bacterium]